VVTREDHISGEGQILASFFFPYLFDQHYRSVHNIRIERLWRDLTLGFAGKWKHFFQHLEFYYGLNHDNPAHIWLLHYLVLDAVNEDARRWAEAWNHHVLSIRGERNQTPAAMFFLGMLENGVRGINFLEETFEGLGEAVDWSEYGIDWEDFLDDEIHTSHESNNPPDGLLHPQDLSLPLHMSHIEVEVPESPLNDHGVDWLDATLNSTFPDILDITMDARVELWVSAKALCGV
jgi:hypothetical protein